MFTLAVSCQRALAETEVQLQGYPLEDDRESDKFATEIMSITS